MSDDYDFQKKLAKYLKSTSNSVSSEMRRLYTPLGQEQNYEKLEEEGYFKQKTAPQNPMSVPPIEKPIEKVTQSAKEISNTISKSKPQDFFSQIIEMFKSWLGFFIVNLSQ